MSKPTYVLAVWLFALVACNTQGDPVDGATTHPNATLAVSTTADLMGVRAEQSVPLTIDARNLILVAPNVVAPADHADDAVYLEVHLDNESGAPLLVTAETSVSITIPAGTAAGPHVIICRAHDHDDGAPTDVMTTLDLTVIESAAASMGMAPSTAVF
jgi:hypothetical protein